MAYVAGATEPEASALPRVPYRHVMSASKRHRVGRWLAERWDVRPPQSGWYPLREGPVPEDVLVLQDASFYLEVGAPALQRILRSHGIRVVWELNELRLHPEYEMDPSLCTFAAGVELYWSSRELDWLVYRSHEESITFAGAWLIEAIQQAWPNWQQRVYTTHGYLAR